MTRLDKLMVGVLIASALALGGMAVVAVIYPETRVPMLIGAASGLLSGVVMGRIR